MSITSYPGGIDSVVVPVRTDEPDEHHAPVVVHGSNQTIVAALLACSRRGSKKRSSAPPAERRALLHGFSRGSANVYAVAAIDNGMGRKLFSLYVASSGGVALDYPPTRAILEGRFGPRPLAGTRWITACGDRDPNPDRDGCPGMRRTGQWLKEQGAILLDVIEDPQSGHGALQLDPHDAAYLIDHFVR